MLNRLSPIVAGLADTAAEATFRRIVSDWRRDTSRHLRDVAIAHRPYLQEVIQETVRGDLAARLSSELNR